MDATDSDCPCWSRNLGMQEWGSVEPLNVFALDRPPAPNDYREKRLAGGVAPVRISGELIIVFEAAEDGVLDFL